MAHLSSTRFVARWIEQTSQLIICHIEEHDNHVLKFPIPPFHGSSLFEPQSLVDIENCFAFPCNPGCIVFSAFVALDCPTTAIDNTVAYLRMQRLAEAEELYLGTIELAAERGWASSAPLQRRRIEASSHL